MCCAPALPGIRATCDQNQLPDLMNFTLYRRQTLTVMSAATHTPLSGLVKRWIDWCEQTPITNTLNS